MDEIKEYATFKTTTSAGAEVEMAVVDEFEIKNKQYIAASLIDGDAIGEEIYIYRVKLTEDDFIPEKITNHIEYQEVAEAYLEMSEA